MWHIFPVFWRKAEIGTLIRQLLSVFANVIPLVFHVIIQGSGQRLDVKNPGKGTQGNYWLPD